MNATSNNHPEPTMQVQTYTIEFGLATDPQAHAAAAEFCARGDVLQGDVLTHIEGSAFEPAVIVVFSTEVGSDAHRTAVRR